MADLDDSQLAAGAGDHPPPHPRDLVAALGLLTVLPAPKPAATSAAFARATLFFPLVGLLIGAVLAGVHQLVGARLPAWLSASLVVGLWEALTAAEALRAWAPSKAARTGLGATAGMALVMLIKVVCVARQGASRPAALLFAPMLARWSMVVLAVGARDARAPARKLNAAITFREFAWTSVFSFVVVFAVAEAFGIFVVVCVAAATLIGRLLSHRTGGGVSWHSLLASAQAIEALVLVLFALL